MFIIFKYLKKSVVCLNLRHRNGMDFMYCHKAVRKEKEINCVCNCVAFIILIVLSCHLRLGLCTLDLTCTVLQINMCCCKSLYNILLICLFLCGSCIDILRTTFASVPVLSPSLSLLNCTPSTSALIQNMPPAKLPTEKSPSRIVRFHKMRGERYFVSEDRRHELWNVMDC